MDVWVFGQWITIDDDFTGREWDYFENFESLVERKCDDVDFIMDYNRTVGLDKVIDYD